MNLHVLPFARITILEEDLAEVVVNHGVEMDLDMVNEYHQFLIAHLNAPFSLLINKENSYSYNFDAQEHLATLEEIKAMAVVAYNTASQKTTEGLLEIPRAIDWNLKIFDDRTDALNWLTSN